MLPASLRHDCSSTSNVAVVPSGRRSSMSHTLRPTASGKSSRVRPVRSPSMCMSTAATTSLALPSSSGTSSSRAMLISGTLIMMRRLVSWDSAVAACPAPMFATSLSASSCSALRSRTSSMPSPSLEQPTGVQDQRGHAVAHDRGPAEDGQGPLRHLEALHDDLLLAQHSVHHDAAAPLAHLEHADGPPDGRRLAVCPEQGAQV